MRITSIWLGILLCGACGGETGAQNPPPPKPQGARQRGTESFWHKVLRVSGIAVSPNTLKGPGDEVVHGQIWIADLVSGSTRRLNSIGGFRSPVFLGGDDLLALKDASVVRVSLSGGKVASLYPAASIIKLVGLSMDDPDKVLVLLHGNSDLPTVALLSVSTGRFDSLPYDRSSVDDRHMVEQMLAWDRDYGDTNLYIDQQTKSGMSGTLSWTDVFLKRKGGTPIDVSKCNGVNCGQPSLSADGKSVAYVKADQD